MESRRLGKKLGVRAFVKTALTYRDPGADAYEAHHRARTLRHLRNRARQHGFGLIHLETGELLEGAVS